MTIKSSTVIHVQDSMYVRTGDGTSFLVVRGGGKQPSKVSTYDWRTAHAVTLEDAVAAVKDYIATENVARREKGRAERMAHLARLKNDPCEDDTVEPLEDYCDLMYENVTEVSSTTSRDVVRYVIVLPAPEINIKAKVTKRKVVKRRKAAKKVVAKKTKRPYTRRAKPMAEVESGPAALPVEEPQASE